MGLRSCSAGSGIHRSRANFLWASSALKGANLWETLKNQFSSAARKQVIARVSFPSCKSPIRCQAGSADATGADQESHI
jgi:hypothetical protein